MNRFHHAIDVVRSTNDAATTIWMVIEPGRTSRKYANAHSLVWRDAGVVLAGIALVAAAMNFACRPLGMTGEPELSAALGFKALRGAGGLLVGHK
ncbi:MAG TPA: hypothetical protein VJR92_10985 [Gemmatimonadaceae bacterium]|nr:hypothetical protein [Gemmatimonadaceae bacterium]